MEVRPSGLATADFSRAEAARPPCMAGLWPADHAVGPERESQKVRKVPTIAADARE